jgi:hypothetical protein
MKRQHICTCIHSYYENFRRHTCIISSIPQGGNSVNCKTGFLCPYLARESCPEVRRKNRPYSDLPCFHRGGQGFLILSGLWLLPPAFFSPFLLFSRTFQERISRRFLGQASLVIASSTTEHIVTSN